MAAPVLTPDFLYASCMYLILSGQNRAIALPRGRNNGSRLLRAARFFGSGFAGKSQFEARFNFFRRIPLRPKRIAQGYVFGDASADFGVVLFGQIPTNHNKINFIDFF
jgi:hypothetical protein